MSVTSGIDCAEGSAGGPALAVIASAGYVGASLPGSVLLIVSQRLHRARLILFCLALGLGLSPPRGSAVSRSARASGKASYDRSRHRSGVPVQHPERLPPRSSAERTAARIAAFIPGASPPLVSTATRILG